MKKLTNHFNQHFLFYFSFILFTTLGLEIGHSQNNSLNFDGTNDRITLADNSAFDYSNGFTGEAWVYPDLIKTQIILSQWDTNQEAFTIILLSTGKIEFTVSQDGTNDRYYITSGILTANSWQHVSCTYHNGVFKVYIDGILDTGGTYTGSNITGVMYNSNATIEIGSRNNYYHFDGNIDEVKIWGKVLSIDDVNDNKDCKIPTNSEGLICYYDFDQGISEGNNTSITLLNDASPNQLDASLNNFSKTTSTSNFVSGVDGDFLNTNCSSELAIEQNISEQIKIFPNPVLDELIINNNDNLNIQKISLCNIFGQLIQIIEPKQKTINLGNLSDGIYFLNIETDNGSASKKIIKK